MTDDVNDEERAARERLLELAKKQLSGGDAAGDLTDALSELLRTRGAREGIDEERENAIQTAIREFVKAMQQGGPGNSSSAPGTTRSEQLREEARVLAEQAQGMRRAMESMAHIAHDVQRDTRIPEAAPVLGWVHRATHQTIQESMRPGGVDTSRFHEATMALGNAFGDLQTVDSVAALNRMRRDRIYPALVKIRRILLEGHAMLVRPHPGRIATPPNPNEVCVLATDERTAALAPVLAELGLNVAPHRLGASEALNRWEMLLGAWLVVCDMSVKDPQLRAAICCQLGWARALGRPVVVLAEPGHVLPFDVDVEPVDPTDRAALQSAVQDAMFVPRRADIDRKASLATVDELERRYADHPDDVLRQTLKLLRDRRAEGADDGALYDSIGSVLRFAPNSELDLITPAWPPAYPDQSQQRLFHVMPFHSDWSDAARDEARKATESAGARYRRHDLLPVRHVLRSLWEEIAAASHVLVDITGLNENVMVELGMTLVLGKPFKLVSQVDPEELGSLHPVLKYWQVTAYRSDKPNTLARAVGELLAT